MNFYLLHHLFYNPLANPYIYDVYDCVLTSYITNKKKHILHINWIDRHSSESVYDGQAFK